MIHVKEWGMEPMTWDNPDNSPLIDLGDKAREALKKAEEVG